MTLQEWALIGTTIVAIATAVWTGVKTLADRRQGVRSTEHTARRDTVADRDALIDQLQAERDKALERASAAETSAAALRTALIAEQDYAAVLRDHIYRRQAPPPPPRST